MKVLIIFVFALALTAASANSVSSAVAVHPHDFPEAIAPEGRITNGNDAAPGQFPYQVGLNFASSKGGWFCGGSLIANNWVLTAAHCTKGAVSVEVYLGAIERLNPEVKFTVQKDQFRQHKNYNSLLTTNDISLIKIPSVSYTKTISPIALPRVANVYSSYTGQSAIASGWGLTSDATYIVSPKLQYATLKVINNSRCTTVYGPLTITSNTICTANPETTSTCQGDSGGPLVLESDNTLIGITSFVHVSGCQTGKPAGFVRVTSYLDWIAENMK